MKMILICCLRSQIPGRYGSQQTRPGRPRLHGQGLGHSDVDVPQVRRCWFELNSREPSVYLRFLPSLYAISISSISVLLTGVISLDLAWSSAVESQAFDRVHRLGQMREVFVHRLVIENTVEDRVLMMQERKVRCSL